MSKYPSPPKKLPPKFNLPPPPPPPPKLALPKPPKEVFEGKILPNATDLEEAVLGAILIDDSCFESVYNILSEKVFYYEKNRFIYKAILNTYERKEAIDLLTISNELKRMNKLGFVGGDFYLIELTRKISSSAHIEFHSRIVLQKYILRELIHISDETINKAYSFEADAVNLINDLEVKISKVYEVAIKEGLSEDKNKLNNQKKDLLEKVRNNEKGIISGFMTSLAEFDEWSGGFQPTDLVTIAARPSMGKTTVAIAIAMFNAFVKNLPVAIFSLEMSEIDIKNKATAGQLNIPYANIRQGKLTQTQLTKVFQNYDLIDKSKLKIIDTSEHKNYFHNIERKIRELHKEGIKLFIIDYVQLIKLLKSSGNDTSDLSKITRDLKALASELKITIIELAQLNRNVDSRPDKTPMLSDLKMSGSIEEDSDIVIFLLRDAYYETIGKPDLILPLRELGKTKFIVAKGRHVGVRTFLCFVDMLSSKISTF